VPAGACPYAWRFAEEAGESDAAAVVVTTACDQMRRVAETVGEVPVFLMNIPATWQTPASFRLYRDELERLGRFLARLGGTTPDANALAETMLAFDTARQQLRDLRGSLSPRAFAEAIQAFHEAGEPALPDSDSFQNPLSLRERAGVRAPSSLSPRERAGVRAGPQARSEGVTRGRRHAPPPQPSPTRGEGAVLNRASQSPFPGPIALLGGPLPALYLSLFDAVEKAGGTVVLNGTENGERGLPAPFDRRRVREDPLGELVDAYFGTIPDPFRRPNSIFFDWLARRIEERGVRGILLHRFLWCDLWHAEVARIREWTGLPVVELDAGDTGDVSARTATRVETLVEMLR
jgi:benzoyl-CoA reductase/2-hydroxyglutaryl-CoA dehydratase subunit BcrC/BadD/HgdB